MGGRLNKEKTMTKYSIKTGAVSLVGLLAFFIACQNTAMAQEASEPSGGGAQIIEPGEEALASEFVTINVKDANIAEVLKAYSLQTGQSIVVGPDVVSDNVNVRLNNIPWEEALDVILKPYGFGYRVVGDTIVISKLENIVTVEGIEPLASKVFNLRYLDAYDIKDICTAQLTSRGKFTILETKGLPGWEFGGEGTGGAATEAGIRRRKKKEQIQKSKTFVITDVPSAITKIEDIIEEMDILPEQVLIEAKFLEISSGGLTDIGLDYISAMENVQQDDTPTAPDTTLLEPELLKVLAMSQGIPNPLNTAAAGSFSQDGGIRLSHSVLNDWGADMLFAFMATDDDANVLSSPKVLTLNNQEAAILVGKKFPIIESQSNSGSGGSSITSTRLDYYENIGIQLNVIPQVCDSEYVNMIVHPAVSEIEGFEAGVVTAGTEAQSGTQYPILKVREAETQIMIKSSETAIIGGLQEERDREAIKKVPLLGDIPFLGRLFRRETLTKEKVDLLIFIKASIVENEAYAIASKMKQDSLQSKMGLDLIEEEETEPAITIEKEAVAAEEAENEEILALVHEMGVNGETNQVDTVEVVETVDTGEM